MNDDKILYKVLPDHSTFIIAEAGVNHNGDVNIATQLIDAAVECGVDAIKFQSFIPELLVSAFTPKAEYQKKHDSHTSQLDMLKDLALTHEQQKHLYRYCREKKILFLSSPFDLDSALFLLKELSLPVIKIGSGELTNAPLLYHIAQHGAPIILSTGMSNLVEIKQALSVLAFAYAYPGEVPDASLDFNNYQLCDKQKRVLQNKVALLHCTSEYPCPYTHVHLNAMHTLRESFGLTVGYSDHTEGIEVAIAAVTLGAVIIEKHFTLDRTQPGPDHLASIEPWQLKSMVDSIRHTQQALGSSVKQINECELSTRSVVRKHLVANCRIKKGELLTSRNINCKRTVKGISPMYYWKILNTVAHREYQIDDAIEL